MSSRAGVRFVIALAAVVAGAGALSLARPGYTPDEEFTLFAVRGITAHGLPLLPSGLLYDRGLLYSYLSWAAGVATGAELPAFRALSLACGVATLGLGYALVGRVASVAAAVAACALVAASLPFWAAITTGRFYGPFLLTCVGVLFVLAPDRTQPHLPAPVRTRPHLPALLACAFASRLTHELAFTLLAIPAAALILSRTDARAGRVSRRDWAMASLAILAGLGAAQVLLVSLHFLMPPSGGGGTMIRRFFLWQVLNLFERPSGAPVGVVCAAVVVGLLLAPRQWRRIVRLGAIALIAVVLAALAYGAATTSSPPLLQAALGGSLAYPLDMFWHLAATRPLMVWLGLVLLILRLCGAGGEWPAGERAAHLGWVGWTLWFGLIESGITINYVLLPTVCLLTAIGLDLVAIAEHTRAIWPGRRAQAIRAGLAGLALAVVADQWRGAGPLTARLAAARPTIHLDGIDAVRADLRPDDLVACTDELACLLLVGRVDAWLALDDYVRERFVVMRGAGPVGVYAGVPAAFTVAELVDRAGAQTPPARVIVADVFKEYPVGNSSAWLPRALAADGLAARTLLATSQARVVEIRR